MTTGRLIFGVDIGGSGIKGAPVDPDTGQLSAKRYRIATPQPSTPAAVASGNAEATIQRTAETPSSREPSRSARSV